MLTNEGEKNGRRKRKEEEREKNAYEKQQGKKTGSAWGSAPTNREKTISSLLLHFFSLAPFPKKMLGRGAVAPCCSSRASRYVVAAPAKPSSLRPPRELVVPLAVAPPFRESSASFPAADASTFVIRPPRTDAEFYSIAALRAEAYYAVRKLGWEREDEVEVEERRGDRFSFLCGRLTFFRPVLTCPPSLFQNFSTTGPARRRGAFRRIVQEAVPGTGGALAARSSDAAEEEEGRRRQLS